MTNSDFSTGNGRFCKLQAEILPEIRCKEKVKEVEKVK